MTYDIAGNVLTSADYAGTVTSYTYDNLDRLIQKTVGSDTTSFTYTLGGQLSSVTDKNGVTAYTYDIMNGLTAIDLFDGNRIEYSYDSACRLTEVDTDFGSTSYQYDIMDRLTRVIAHDGTATVYEYDANGNRTEARYSNGLVITYTYDDVNRLILQTALDNNDNIVAQYSYTVGSAGERTRIEELDRTVDYEYDSLYRLTKETVTKVINGQPSVSVTSYTYDANSNRLTKNKNGAVTNYSYNALNQLVSETGITYSYDLNGNLILKTEGGTTTRFAYDSGNRLIRATIRSGQNVTVEEYNYDFAGNRIAKTTEGETVNYLVDTNGMLSQVLAELDDTGGLITWYTRGNELISLSRPNETRFYLYDGHGSTRLLTDEDGAVTDTYTFDAYGNLTARTGATVNDFLYCGEQFDQTTGLYYLRARYMNPQTGTFISMDVYQGSIFDPVSLHKYLYANANPVMNVDPTGYFTFADLHISENIQGILDKMASLNVKKILDIFRAFGTVANFYDMAKSAYLLWQDAESFGAFASEMLRGYLVSKIISSMYNIIALNPVVAVILAGMSFYMQAESLLDAIEKGQWDLVIARTLSMTAMVISIFMPTCFAGDTLVATEDGYNRIDEIETGDLVWAYNVETGELELKEVLTVYVKENREILHLETSTGDINTTTNHPFYVVGEGWVAAGDLEVGDEVYALDGSVSVITGYWLEVFDTPVTVYNLEVDGFHTYFVGEFGVLVHNVYAYQVGTYEELQAGSAVGDNLDIHHVPQGHPAGQVISGYDYNKGPAIAIPHKEHLDLNAANIRGTYSGTAEDLLNKGIEDLGVYTNAPDSAFAEIRKLCSKLFPLTFGN